MHTEQTIGTAEKQARTPAILDSALGRLNEALAKGLGRWMVALVLFSVAAVVQTWPLVLHASTSIIDTPEQVHLEFTLAGIGSRFMALLIDTILQSLVYFAVFLLAVFVIGVYWNVSRLNQFPNMREHVVTLDGAIG